MRLKKPNIILINLKLNQKNIFYFSYVILVNYYYKIIFGKL